jgi:plasmid segregation protein ParM
MTLLAVDAGRSEVEYKSSTLMGAFPSPVAEAVHQNNPVWLEGDLEIEIEGKKWWVGNLAKREGGGRDRSNFGESKADEILKVQVIASVIYADLIESDIDLGVIVPIKKLVKEETNAIKKLLIGTHEVRYKLVKQTRKEPSTRECSIKINEKLLIAQEGAMAFWSDPRDENTQILDFGAKTINFAYYDFYLYNKPTYVNAKSGTEWNGWETTKQQFGFSKKNDDQINVNEIKKMASSLAKTAINVSGKLDWDTDCLTQIFGGVAHVVYPYIKEKFPRAYVPEDPRNGNVIGLFHTLEEAHAYV